MRGPVLARTPVNDLGSGDSPLSSAAAEEEPRLSEGDTAAVVGSSFCLSGKGSQNDRREARDAVPLAVEELDLSGQSFLLSTALRSVWGF